MATRIRSPTRSAGGRPRRGPCLGEGGVQRPFWLPAPCYPRFRCASVVPRAGCSGSRVPRLCTCARWACCSRSAAPTAGPLPHPRRRPPRMRSRSRPSRRRSPSSNPLAAAIPVDVEPPTRAWDAHEGDRDSLVPASVAPSDSDGRAAGRARARPRRRGGHPPDHAYRRDESTLRYRLTDGANEWQQARTHTSGRSSSPQAIRREPVVGIGDSVRSQTPPVTGAIADLVRRARRPAGAGPVEANNEAAAPTEAPIPVPSAELAVIAGPARGTGPLDADQGARSFDSERTGKAADNDTLRAASNELHPGLTDFARPAAAAATASRDGRGPGLQAGAVARPAAGTAPTQLGLPDRAAAAAEASERARARQQARYELRDQTARQRGARIPQAARAPSGARGDRRVFRGRRRRAAVGGPTRAQVVGIRGVRQRRDPGRPACRAVSGDALLRPDAMAVTFDNPVIR